MCMIFHTLFRKKRRNTNMNNYFPIRALETLLAALDEAISIIDTDGIVVYWNRAAENIYNISQNEIIGKDIQTFFHRADLMNFKVLTSEEPVYDLYHQPRHNMHVLVTTVPIYDEGKNLIGSMSVEKNITATIKLNEKLSSTSTELQKLKKQMQETQYQDPFHRIKGSSIAITNVIRLAKKVAKTDATVLVLGESGTGKELFAQAIHEDSLRKNEAFIAVNCGAIPQALFESELFGYEPGSYTGADKNGKPGKMELAHKGTLFLDEVGELPLDMQVKLLRALQEKEIYRIGGQKPRKVDIRIIAATNRNLEMMVREGLFREDLYYRLHVFHLDIPPLCERMEDIFELLNTFLKEYASKYKKEIPLLKAEQMAMFYAYSWPGNIRELRNFAERLVVLHEEGERIEEIAMAFLPKEAGAISSSQTVASPLPPVYTSLAEERQLTEKEKIKQTLEKTYNNKTLAAKELGIARSTLYQKLKKYGLC